MATILRLAAPSPVQLRHSFLRPIKPTTITTTTIPLRLSSSRKPQAFTITASSKSSYTPVPATDRLISSAAYFLPLFNGLQYARFLFMKYPILAVPFEPIIPILSLYHSIPSASFVTFFALYLGIVRNDKFSRYVRFNALQAVILDVMLAVPALLQMVVSPAGKSAFGIKVTSWAHSGIFCFVFACFVYGLVSSILGKTPYLPYVADAAGRQIDAV